MQCMSLKKIKNYNVTIWKITMQVSSDSVDSELIKPWLQTKLWVLKGIQINREHVKNLLFIDKNYNATIFDITIHASKDSVDIKLFKERPLTNTGALIWVQSSA